MDHLEDFDVLAEPRALHQLDPIETLGRMATADALIMSRSSFSYVAALLSQNCTVVCYPFWHSAMKEWLRSGPMAQSPKRLFERASSHGRRRGV